MSLKDEKVLLKEIDQLKQSKKLVSHLAANNDSISSDRKSSQSISEHLSAKNAELDVLKKKIEEQKQILDSLNESNSGRRVVLPALFKDKDALRKEKQAKVETIKALRAEFRTLENEFRGAQRAERGILYHINIFELRCTPA
jgi:septal ring factor EnvC (AmiA/AmiB activator)